MPGVSTRRAPPGSSNSSRWVVVCRPRESETRTSAVRWRASPSRALTRVDLPTPDDPRMAAVEPGRRWASSSSSPAPVQAETGSAGDAGRDRVDRDQPAVDVVGEVRLVQDHDRGDPARPGHREVALDPAQVEVVVEPGHQQRDLDVRGHDLLVVESGATARPVGGQPLEDAATGQDRGDDALAVERDPVADGRVVGGREGLEAERSRDRGRPVAVRIADDRGLPMDGHDPGRPSTPRRVRREGDATSPGPSRAGR